MIRVLVLGLIRGMLVAVWLLVSTAVMLLLIGGMILRMTRVVPKDDDLASAVIKIYNVIVYKMGSKKGFNVPL